MSVTIAIILDKRRRNKETKNYPVCLRVTFNRRSRIYPLGPEMSRSYHRKVFLTKDPDRLPEKLREDRLKSEKEQQRAKKIIDKINNFSFPVFAQEFTGVLQGKRQRKSSTINPAAITALPTMVGAGMVPLRAGADETPSGGNKREFKKNQFGERKYPQLKSHINFRKLGQVAFYYGEYIIKLEKKNQHGTASNYMCSLASLLAFRPQISFGDIDEFRLYEYEKWMEAKGRSITTISMYLRALRHIFNIAVAKDIVEKENYPFGPEKYVIPGDSTIKQAHSLEEIRLLWDYQSDSQKEMMFRDLWFFLYLGNGMNVKDMALLKRKNLSGEFIRFFRAKTINTTRTKPKLITVVCTEALLRIIERWGNVDRHPESYLFPILTLGMTAMEQRLKIQLFIKLMNTYLKEIGKALHIPLKPVSGKARHDMATQLKRSGVSSEAIQEIMGHYNIRTTMGYLDSFEDAAKKEHVKNLLPFANEQEDMSTSSLAAAVVSVQYPSSSAAERPLATIACQQ